MYVVGNAVYDDNGGRIISGDSPGQPDAQIDVVRYGDLVHVNGRRIEGGAGVAAVAPAAGSTA